MGSSSLPLPLWWKTQLLSGLTLLSFKKSLHQEVKAIPFQTKQNQMFFRARQSGFLRLVQSLSDVKADKKATELKKDSSFPIFDLKEVLNGTLSDL